MVSFEIFVKAMPPSLLELKVLLNFCFPIKIRDDRAVTNKYTVNLLINFLDSLVPNMYSNSNFSFVFENGDNLVVLGSIIARDRLENFQSLGHLYSYPLH